MAKISKKAKIEPVREANELAVENEYKNEEVKEGGSVKDLIMADVKKLSVANQWAGMNERLKVEEIEAILNKYFG